MRLRITEGFTEDVVEKVSSERVLFRIYEALDRLDTIPELGSSRLPESVATRFGSSVRKLVVSPFVVIYEINEKKGTLDVLALLHQRQAY